MDSLGLVELKCLRDAFDDALGDAGGVAALQPGVVLAGDAREQGDFLAAQPGDPSALSAVEGQSGLVGGDPGPPRAQELPDLRAEITTDVAVGAVRAVPACHALHSTSALGADIAREALAAGHRVVATGRRPDEVEKTLGGPQDNLLATKLDVTSIEDAQAAAQAAVDRFGRIDVLINNAGNLSPATSRSGLRSSPARQMMAGIRAGSGTGPRGSHRRVGASGSRPASRCPA